MIWLKVAVALSAGIWLASSTLQFAVEGSSRALLAGASVVAQLGLAAALVLLVRGWLVQMRADLEQGSSVASKQLEANLQTLLELNRRFPSLQLRMTTSSMEPGHLAFILELLDEIRPRRIVEFGSGASTIVMALWMQAQPDGEVLSIEHDEAWARRCGEELRLNAATSRCRIVVAPLKVRTVAGALIPWYDVEPHLARLRDIDFLLVDGPPAYGVESELARLPALPVLRESLTHGAIVVLDDADRRGERAIVREWLRAFPEFTEQRIPSRTGLSVLRATRPAAGGGPAHVRLPAGA